MVNIQSIERIRIYQASDTGNGNSNGSGNGNDNSNGYGNDTFARWHDMGCGASWGFSTWKTWDHGSWGGGLLAILFVLAKIKVGLCLCSISSHINVHWLSSMIDWLIDWLSSMVDWFSSMVDWLVQGEERWTTARYLVHPLRTVSKFKFPPFIYSAWKYRLLLAENNSCFEWNLQLSGYIYQVELTNWNWN